MNERNVQVRIVRLPHADGLEPPAYQSSGAAGLDLSCALAGSESRIGLAEAAAAIRAERDSR